MTKREESSNEDSIANSVRPHWVSWQSYSTPEEPEVPVNLDRFAKAIRKNETKIDTNDSDFKGRASNSKIKDYDRFNKLNIGRWNGKWSDQTRENRIFKKNLCEIVTGKLDLKDFQTSRVVQLFQSLDLRRYRTYDTEVIRTEGGKRDKWPLIIFCTSILVCWESGRVYYPDANSGEDKKDPIFAHIAERLKLADDAVISCVGKLRHDLRDLLYEPEDPPNKLRYSSDDRPFWSLAKEGWGGVFKVNFIQ